MLSALTYRDMVDFSEIVAEKLGGVVEAEKIAEAMSDLPHDNEQTIRTNEVLNAAFSRKRNISVQRAQAGGGAYHIRCESLNAGLVAEDIREGISQLLDTITVVQSLTDHD